MSEDRAPSSHGVGAQAVASSRPAVLECVVNVSEGRDAERIGRLAHACGPALLDVHADPDHHRSVFTLGGGRVQVEAATRSLARAVVEEVDLTCQHGAHPRIGALDVVPFVALAAGAAEEDPPRGAELPHWRLVDADDLSVAAEARDGFAGWAGRALALPGFLYGPLGERSRPLPEIRRQAFAALAPDTGPPRPHPTAGAVAVGARPLLVAYNLWVSGADAALARTVAAALRGPSVRALGLELSRGVQVSCNLVEPLRFGPAQLFDAAARLLEPHGAGIGATELVGLAPAAILAATPRHRWAELGLDPAATIEARLDRAGFSWPG